MQFIVYLIKKHPAREFWIDFLFSFTGKLDIFTILVNRF